MKSNVKKLNKLIAKYLPKIFKSRVKKIHCANDKFMSSKVSKKGDINFGNMTFKRILTYGRNRITKRNSQLKNYENIKVIIKYIEEYYIKYHKLSIGLKKIINLLYMKPISLILWDSQNKNGILSFCVPPVQ